MILEQEAPIVGRRSRLRRRAMMGMAMLAPLVFTAGLKLAPLSQANEVKTEKDCNPRPALTFPSKQFETVVFACYDGSFRMGNAEYERDDKGKIKGVDMSKLLSRKGKVRTGLHNIPLTVDAISFERTAGIGCKVEVTVRRGAIVKAGIKCESDNEEPQNVLPSESI